MDYPIEYVKLLSNTDIDPIRHTLIIDPVAMEVDIRDYTTPYSYNPLLSSMAYNFLIKLKDFTPKIGKLEKDSLYYVLNSTTLPTRHYGIHAIIKGIYLETLAINYANDNDNTMFDALSIEDVKRVRTNIDYVCDWLGEYREYRPLLEYFRTLNLSLGYIQNRLDVLLNGVNKINGML